MKKSITFFSFFALILLFTLHCTSPGSGDGSGGSDTPTPGSDFIQYNNCGTVTVQLLGADDDHNGHSFGTSIETPYSPDSRVGQYGTIASDDQSFLIEDVSSNPSSFREGTVVELWSFIDHDNNGLVNDGDFIGTKTITTNGDTVATFTYPGDFTIVSNSGNITVRLLGANGDYNGFDFGVSVETPYYMSSRVYGMDTITSDTMSVVLEDENNDILTYHGGAGVKVWCFIDTNDDNMVSSGEYISFKTITINNDTIVDFNYPADFTQALNCGSVTVRLLGANGDHNGVYFRSGGETPYSPSSRIHQQSVINSDTMSILLEDKDGNVMTFHGGAVLEIGCFIDANNDGPFNDGDYLATKTVTINGDTIVDFTY